MKEIKFKAAYGDEEREVGVGQVSGSMNGIHIYIDNYYHGSIHSILGKWFVHWVDPTDKSIHQERYVSDDSDAVLDRLRDAGWMD